MQRKPSFSSLPPVIFHKYDIDRQLENGVFGEILKAYKRPDVRDEDEDKKDKKGKEERTPVTIRTFR